MKKQLTVFAAAAMLATFATAAMAATPTLSGSFTFPYSVTYDITTSSWAADPADNTVDTVNYDNYIALTIPATEGSPRIGAVSLNLWFDGLWFGPVSTYNPPADDDSDPTVTTTIPWNPALTLSGEVFGGTLSLGQVDFYADNLVGTGTGAAGAKFVGTYGPIDVIAGTAAPAAFGRVGVKLSDTNSVYAGAATKADFNGIAFAGGNFTAGAVVGSAQAAAELGDDNGTGLKADATVTVNDMLSFSACAIMANDMANTPFVNIDAVALADNEMGSIGWAAQNPSRANGLNLKVGATVKPIEEMTITGNYFTFADSDWKVAASVSYAPIALTSATATLWKDSTVEVIANFDKTIAGLAFYATAAYKDTPNAVPAVDPTYYAYLKATKVWEGWFSTWASFGVHAYGEAAKAKVGATASITF